MTASSPTLRAPMATSAASSPARLAFADVEQELAGTRRVLERITDEDFDFTPHAKSWPLGRIATHVATLPWWGTHICGHEEIQLQGIPAPETARTRDELLARFDATAAEFREALAGVGDDALGRTYTVKFGEQVLMAAPKGVMLRTMTLNHLVHHRAQVTMYLRLRERPVPGLYGPSADETFGG